MKVNPLIIPVTVILLSLLLAAGIGGYLIYKHVMIAWILRGQLQPQLPAALQPQLPPADEVDIKSSDVPEMEDEAPEVSVIVKASNKGNIGKIAVRKKTREVSIPLDNWPASLCGELEKLRGGLTNKTSIKIEADTGLKWAEVVEIMESCKKAGFENVGFSPPAGSR